MKKKWPWQRGPKEPTAWEQDTTRTLARIEALVNVVIRQGGQLMSTVREQAEAIKARLVEVGEGLGAIDTRLDGVREDLGTVDTTVKTLIERLGQVPPSPELEEALALANELAERTGRVKAETDQVGDALKAIPTAPPA